MTPVVLKIPWPARHPRNDILLRRCLPCQHNTWLRQHSGQYPQAQGAEESIAILGGGITGLTTAFYLLNRRRKTRLTLLESSSRYGGWIQSTKYTVGDGDVIFEHGPRTLRPSGGPQAELMLQLVRHYLLPNFAH